jgi:preprotein translocase subunit YajC
MLVVLGLAFWLMVLRPARGVSEPLTIQNQLTIGQRVMTTAGMFGYVRELDDAEVGLEVSEGVVVRYMREAIAKVVDEVAPAVKAVADVSDSEETVVDVSRNQ